MTDWDERKRAANLAKHGVDFAAVSAFEWETALTSPDERGGYPEPRFLSLGFIGDRLHAVAWTPRDGGRRIISLRKANRREVRRYADAI